MANKGNSTVENEIKKQEGQVKTKKKKRRGLKIGLGVFFGLVLLVLIFLGVLKFDVAGLGSKTIGPALRGWPLSSYYLPPLPEEEEEGEQAQSYETIEEVVEILKVTERMLKEKEEQAEILTERLRELEKENDRLRVFENKQKVFEENKRRFDTEIVEATDAQAYIQWYEKINPDNAAALYEKMLKKDLTQAELTKLTKIYSEMKAEKAAVILEDLSATRLEMVASIMRNLDSDQAAKILANMDKKTAARLTTYLYPEE